MTGNKSYVKHTCTEETKKKTEATSALLPDWEARDGGGRKKNQKVQFFFIVISVNATEFVSQSGHMCVPVLKPPAVETERCA